MPRTVTIGDGFENVQLPDGLPYNDGDVVVLTDEQWALISPSAITAGIIVDGGAVDENDNVSVQGAHQGAPAALTSSAPAALTSSQNATAAAATQTGSYVQADVQSIRTLANALQTSYNAAQVDIAALRTTLAATQADVAALRTTVANLITALTGSGKPLHT